MTEATSAPRLLPIAAWLTQAGLWAAFAGLLPIGFAWWRWRKTSAIS